MVVAMSLIKCPECEKEISDKSEICIHCGYPVKDFFLSDIENVLSKINLCLNNIMKYKVNHLPLSVLLTMLNLTDYGSKSI